MDRRTFLGSGGVAVVALGAGCSSLAEWNDPDPVRLGGVSLHSADTESSHRFDAEVLRDGDVVHASTHEIRAARELDGGGQRNYGALVDCEWGSSRGNYAVRVRVDGGDWEMESVPELVEASELDDDCVLVDATYDSSTWIRLEGSCDDGDPDHACEFAT
ncbi:hypothetical protein C491_21346 [Natronococcus amylolyticus DSM 10524]|uniref:Lipoprotein n=1 Tax=Natronococcus amylolyticus DSM 10524 TaxID=1227497 RepID=L9WWD0_9EURY|nr:hypothetical protein [Natronococcus amylolyticus]ELY53476.1 hypothetical protein C491_21346 [Natronococcus amylolyticus DSM 10524]